LASYLYFLRSTQLYTCYVDNIFLAYLFKLSWWACTVGVYCVIRGRRFRVVFIHFFCPNIKFTVGKKAQLEQLIENRLPLNVEVIMTCADLHVFWLGIRVRIRIRVDKMSSQMLYRYILILSEGIP